ncbi:MAG: hypothetical protein JNG85_07280 [Spirochaetaceae bacterium]|nr:hypothetical protein [Spirochaetaceae bacterium]
MEGIIQSALDPYLNPLPIQPTAPELRAQPGSEPLPEPEPEPFRPPEPAPDTGENIDTYA